MSHIETDFQGRIIVNTVKDSATLQDAFRYALTHLDEWADRDIIWDLNEMSAENISFDALQELLPHIHLNAQKRQGVKTALVADKDLIFGIGRMFSMTVEEDILFHMKTFRTIEDARKWIEEE